MLQTLWGADPELFKQKDEQHLKTDNQLRQSHIKLENIYIIPCKHMLKYVINRVLKCP